MEPPTVPEIMLAVPCRGHITMGSAGCLFRMTKRKVAVKFHSTSLLTFTFNTLWALALNSWPRPRYFVMMHDDIEVLDDNWLDTLIAEHKACGADVTSAVVPIKNEQGLTSTAVMDPKTRIMKRLTMTEVASYPTTFFPEKIGRPGHVILPNTGLWVCNFRQPWVEKICFTIRDRIFKDQNGQWVAQCYSEDWDFGAQCHHLGLKVAATTAVKVLHKGEFDFPNFTPWGALKTDDAMNVWNPSDRHYSKE